MTTEERALHESSIALIESHRQFGHAICELKQAGAKISARSQNPTALAISNILTPLSALSDLIQGSVTSATETDAENVTDLISELVGALTQYAEAFGGIDLDSDTSDDDAPVSDSSPMGEALRRIHSANAKNAKVFRETRRTAKAPNCLVA